MCSSALSQDVAWSFHARRLELSRPYRWARGTQHHRDVLLVRLGLGDVVGWGEVALPPNERMDGAALASQAQGLVEGLRADEAFLAGLDLRRAPPRLRCGLSTAWMDAMARQAQQPLAQWLAPGTPRRSVAVNALLTAAEPALLEAEAEAAVAAGHRALKLKVSDDPTDVARAAAVREGAPEAELRLDANGAWGDDALERMHRFADLDIAYIEQPVPPEDEALLARLSRDGPFPVALDESATSPARLDALLAQGIGHVAILKPQRLGGLDRTLEAMGVAARHGARAIVTNSLESSVGLHAALHVASRLPDDEACGLGTSGYIAQDVAPPPALAGGRMPVPGPGLGVAP